MRYCKIFYLITFIIVWGLSPSLYAQNTSSSEVDSTFEKYMDKAWVEIRESEGSDSLQNAYSKEFYEYYQQNPETKTGKSALFQAFIMWGNTGYAKYMDEALRSLDYDSEIWGKIINSLGNIYARNDNLETETYTKLLVDLKEKLADPVSKSAVIYRLLGKHTKDKNKDKAVELAQQLVELDASEFFVDKGLGFLHELESLNVGQKAPNFNAHTVNGEKISLSQLNGQFVLLDFWATWCGPCIPEIPHLKNLWNEFQDSNFEIVGISLDRNESDLSEFINENEVEWPQVLETDGWDGEITKMFNVVGIPRTYLIDPEGVIIAKDLRGEEMIEEIEKHMGK